MRQTFLPLLFFLHLFIGCKQHQEQKKTPEQLRSELLAQESRSPLDYLELEEAVLSPQTKEVRKASLFKKAKYEPDGVLIEGFLNNKATLATFKDITLKVSYYSKTKSILRQKNFVLYEYFGPGSTNRLSIKDYPPEDWNSFNVEVVKADWSP